MAEKALLVNPNRMKPAVAPLALDYLSSALMDHRFQVDILDLCFSLDWTQDIDHYFADNSPVVVGVSLRNTDDTSLGSQEFFIPKFKQISDYIKSRTLAPLILGGAGFSIMPEAILDYLELDLGIKGDGEHALPLLIKKLVSNQDYRSVPGLIYRTDGGFRHNSPSYTDLNNTLSRSRGAIDNQRYFVQGGMGNIETKRGCNKGCIYCADFLSKGKAFRLRSPNSVVDEIESLFIAGIDHFHFCDSEFNLPMTHAEDVCREIIRRGLGDKVRWYTYACPSPFGKEIATMFQKAGCAGINFGVDSGSDRMLRSLGRDFNTDDLKHTADICHKQGFIFMYDLLLGGPGETKETLRQTIEIMKQISPSRVGIALGVRIFPGTGLAGIVHEMGPTDKNPNLQGNVNDNAQFFAPIFYLSSSMGENASHYLAELIEGDERFLFMSPYKDGDMNYNYNENLLLVEAIQSGYRGAFWDILRRLSLDNSTLA